MPPCRARSEYLSETGATCAIGNIHLSHPIPQRVWHGPLLFYAAASPIKNNVTIILHNRGCGDGHNKAATFRADSAATAARIESFSKCKHTEKRDLKQRDQSWPLDHIRMTNALKMAGYDFRFSFGTGAHGLAYGSTQFPEEMIWLWRDYDPKKTSQMYEMESSEKVKPLFGVSFPNRNGN